MSCPRPEYPRPQYVRPHWLCLNGTWEFEVDHGDCGLERGLLERPLQQRITVPFCPESVLSGIGYTGFMEAVWYRREVTIPPEWGGQEILLHFQAVDYDATVWVNGIAVGRHRGGFTPFTCNLKGIAGGGERAVIVVRARDNPRDPQPRGKQSQQYGNHGCLYTRTTGIWQTVWLEPVPATRLERPRLTPHLAAGTISLDQRIQQCPPGWEVWAELRDAAGPIVSAQCPANRDFSVHLELAIPPGRRRPWSPQDPHLYQIAVELRDEAGRVVDAAGTYAGLRGIALSGPAVLLNGRPVFQRLVLDQGYYPDGILTAPSEAALCYDIELALAAGFNGARLHQKVFEERFLYHCDRLGYLVWGEFPDWGCRPAPPHQNSLEIGMTYAAQWAEVLERDYSHPAIIGWCPLNETAQDLEDRILPLDDATRALFLLTGGADNTRPVLDASGYAHRVPETAVYDCHDYEQDPVVFRRNHAGLGAGQPYCNAGHRAWSVPYQGQPFMVSEFGGIWWSSAAAADNSWGYGTRPASAEEFLQRFEGLCGVLLDHPHMFGYCYTQLTDVYQEQNGLFTFDRRPKFDLQRLHDIQQRPAAIEK